ncbi:hypothetical protein Tco_0238249, partial [Tanacetum coccineum]
IRSSSCGEKSTKEVYLSLEESEYHSSRFFPN